MKEQQKIIYRCDHCNKYGLSKSAMKWHEVICFHNPENKRPCFTCHHLVKKECKIDIQHYDGVRAKDVYLMFCNKNNIFLWTPQNEAKGNEIETGESISMPIQCSEFKERDYLTYHNEAK